MRYFYILLCFISVFSFSHPASDIKISYDLTNKTVFFEVEHTVKNIKDHYISSLEVYLNEKLIIKQESSIQYSEKIQKYAYIIPDLKEGDNILVISKCNRVGSFKKDFKIK